MSSSKNTKTNIPLPPNALEYCPDYKIFDADVRKDIKTRFRDHVTSRRNTLIQCVEPPIRDIKDLQLRLQFNNCPMYNDNDEIINNAFNTINNKINNWNGVQFSKQFLAQYRKTGQKMDRKKFNTIAANHQDQTSWKVSGNKFFAPYIARAKQYLYDYCQCIVNINEAQRTEIFDFACISYAVSLLSATIKFHRTKPKPLIRYKTLVKSEGIHIELEQLYKRLEIRSFISCAKRKRKAAEGKSTIKSEAFHGILLQCCNTLYRDQKKKVYELFGVSESMSIDTDDDLKKDTPDIWPEQLQDINNDIDEDSDTYKPYKVSKSPSIDDSNSNNSNSNSNNSQRTFQVINPHEYGIRNDMDKDLINERRDYRETRRQQIRNNINNNGIDENILCQQLEDENNALKVEKRFLLQQIRNMDRNQYNGMPIVTYYNPYEIHMPIMPPQIHQMPCVTNIEFEPHMIMRQNSGGNNSLYTMDMSGITSPSFEIPSFDIDLDNIPNVPQ